MAKIGHSVPTHTQRQSRLDVSYVFQDEKGDIIPVEEDASNITGREAVMLINTLLIIAGFLDIVFGLPSVIICLRELCDCYNPALLTGTYRRVITFAHLKGQGHEIEFKYFVKNVWFCTANEGPVRIHYKYLAPIYVFPPNETVISKREL
jgi:hypothetical protein